MAPIRLTKPHKFNAKAVTIGWTLVKIGARFGTSFQHVSEIVRGLKWSSV